MDKIMLAFAAIAIGVGILFIPRSARGATVNEDTIEQPIADLPQGSSPLGLRNNNPFNLEFRNIGWRGEIGTDGRFSVFDSAENGIRAGMINIHTKMTRDGLNTVRKIITTLSPAFENPTESFIQFVSQRLNVAAEQPIQWRTTIIEMSKAIIQVENGKQPFTDEELNDALQATGKV